MNSVVRKTTAAALAAMLVLTGCGEKQEEEVKIDGTQAVMSVNGEDVNLGVAAFYAKYQQASLYQLYQMYFGMTDIYDTVYDEESGQTYGEEMKAEILEELEKMVVISQHAEEYDVTVSDEQQEAIEKAAKAYIDGNSEEVLEKIGASEEDVVRLMELQTLQSNLRDPMVADVDTEVSDEEAQQTTLTYIEVSVPDELPEVDSSVESVVESTVTEVESVLEGTETDSVEATVVEAADTESVGTIEVTESGAESVVESLAEATESYAEDYEEYEYEEPDPELQAYAEAIAQKVLEACLAEENIAEADMDAIAASVDEDLYATSGQFTTNEPIESSLDENLVEAALTLTDGELCSSVIKSVDGASFYVFRVDKVFDEDATATQKDSIVVERKEDAYDALVEEWMDAAEITVDEDVWATLTITDSDPITLATASATEEETTESDVESAVESMVESSVTAVTEVEPVLDDTISVTESATESAVESTASAVESVLSEAESTIS